MSVVLPTSPRPKVSGAVPRYHSIRAKHRSPLTGKQQVVQRLGDYFAIDVNLPPMKWDEARLWRSRLIQGLATTVIFEWDDPGAVVGNPGAPLVAGASQAGYSLNLDAFAASYTVQEGQMFSLVTASGLTELKMATAAKSADGSGVMSALAFLPALRASPADNAAVEFRRPRIEGHLVADDVAWPLQNLMAYGLQFSIEEAG